MQVDVTEGREEAASRDDLCQFVKADREGS